MANHLDSDQAFSGVAQTANLGSSTSVSSGAGKIFREFKWGLLTLFILMAVVVGLVYDGGRKKKTETAANNPGQRLEGGLAGFGESNTNAGNSNDATVTNPATPGTTLGGGNSNVVGGSDQIGTIPNRNARAQILDQDGPDTWNPTPIPNQPYTHGRGANGAQPQRGNRQPNNDMTSDETPARGQGNDNIERETPAQPQRGTGRMPQPNNDPRLAQPQAPATGGKMYVVKAGDSLWKIASTNQLGKNGVKILVDANKDTLPNPDKLREGIKLHIPGANATPATAETPRTTTNGRENRNTPGSDVRTPANAQPTQDTYVVQQGDSLERIARRVLNDGRKWKELLEWNKDKLSDPSKLKVGMTIRTHGGAAGTSSPATAESPVRYQTNPVRAQYDMREEPVFPPENDIAPIPVSPVSASKKISYPLDNQKRSQIIEPDALFSPAN